jgi:hypothetical protein
VLSLGKGVKNPRSAKKGEVTFFYLEDLPPVDPLPFSPSGMDGATYILRFYRSASMNKAVDKEPKEFWDAFAIESIRQFDETYTETTNPKSMDSKQLERLHFGEPKGARLAFLELSAEVLKDLPSEAQRKAQVIWKRLSDKIRNLDCLTIEERRDLEKVEVGDSERLGFSSYGANAFRGRAYSHGINSMYRILLHSANVPHIILQVGDASRAIFVPQQKNPAQIPWPLVGIPQGGKPTLWIDTALRFGQPGMIRSSFLGTLGLEIDPINKTGRITDVLPSMAQVPNKLNYHGILTLGPQAWTTSSSLSWEGASAALRRADLLQMEGPERIRRLEKELFPGAFDGSVKISELGGLAGDATSLGIKLQVEGELPEGKRVSLPPFPGLYLPIEIPASWPIERTVPIRIPISFNLEAEVRMELPERVLWRPQDELDFSNLFGHVRWRVQREGRTLILRLEAKLERMGAPPDSYPALREFCSALSEAFGRKILLERTEAE